MGMTHDDGKWSQRTTQKENDSIESDLDIVDFSDFSFADGETIRKLALQSDDEIDLWEQIRQAENSQMAN